MLHISATVQYPYLTGLTCNALSYRKSSYSYEHVDLIPGNGIFCGGRESLTFTVRQNKSVQSDPAWSREEDGLHARRCSRMRVEYRGDVSFFSLQHAGGREGTCTSERTRKETLSAS